MSLFRLPSVDRVGSFAARQAAAGNADDADVLLLPPGLCQPAERELRIVDDNLRNVLLDGSRNDGAGRTFLPRLLHEIRTVEIRAGKRDEQLVATQRPRVGADTVERPVATVQDPFHRCCSP